MGYPIKIGEQKYVIIDQRGSGNWSQDILLTEEEYQNAIKRRKMKQTCIIETAGLSPLELYNILIDSMGRDKVIYIEEEA